jgi:site-specific recombinase XerD
MHKAFNQIVRKIGLDNLPGAGKLRIHDLRHCCGSALIMRGVDLETVRKILGHRDITTTQKYLHVINDHLKNAINKIEDLGIPNSRQNEKEG